MRQASFTIGVRNASTACARAAADTALTAAADALVGTPLHRSHHPSARAVRFVQSFPSIFFPRQVRVVLPADTPRLCCSDRTAMHAIMPRGGVEGRWHDVAVRALTAVDVARIVPACLTDDLLRPEWRGKGHPLAGHCYVASEAAWHLMGDRRWVPQVMRVDGGTHWFLRHEDGTVLDLTEAQFPGGVDHSRARGCGFLTREPSRRAAEVMRRTAALRQGSGGADVLGR